MISQDLSFEIHALLNLHQNVWFVNIFHLRYTFYQICIRMYTRFIKFALECMICQDLPSQIHALSNLHQNIWSVKIFHLRYTVYQLRIRMHVYTFYQICTRIYDLTRFLISDTLFNNLVFPFLIWAIMLVYSMKKRGFSAINRVPKEDWSASRMYKMIWIFGYTCWSESCGCTGWSESFDVQADLNLWMAGEHSTTYGSWIHISRMAFSNPFCILYLYQYTV